MTVRQNNPTTLNIAPIRLSSDEITIGKLPYLEKDEYQRLREEHWRTHAFRFDHLENRINSLSIGGSEPMGDAIRTNVTDCRFLIARAIQRNILVWLVDDLALTVLRGYKRLLFWGQADNALLLSKALQKADLPKIPNIEVVLRYNIDCRIFQNRNYQQYFGLVIEVATSNIIGMSVSELISRGMKVEGKYVCSREDLDAEYLHPKLDLVGRVRKIEGSRLLLADTDGISEIDSDDAFLEPREENFGEVVQLLCGRNASRVLANLDNLRKPISTAAGKFAHIRKTIEGLRKHSVTIGGNVSIELDDLLSSAHPNYPPAISTSRPTFLFGPQGRKTSPYPDPGITNHGPYMYMQHSRNNPLIAVICESRHRGRVEQFMNMLREGFPKDSWKNTKRANPFPEGMVNKYRLAGMRIEYEECKNPTPKAYEEAVTRLLERVAQAPDLAIIQISESFRPLHGINNPYIVSKAQFMMSEVPTQGIQIEKIDEIDEGLSYLLNTISLAIYAKLDGTPWLISTVRPTTHELIIGLGLAQTRGNRLGSKSRYVGITSVFQGDGRYLLWGNTREVEFDNYSAALLGILRNAVTKIMAENAWQQGDKVRLIFHIYKRLRNSEIDAIKLLVSELTDQNFTVEFAFLDISWWHPYHLYLSGQEGKRYWDREARKYQIKGKGVPDRGLCLLLDKHRGLIQLTGPSELKTAGQGLPKPIMASLHPDSDFDDMTYLLRQLYHFSYMSWRSFFPSPEPVTISYSRLIARLLADLKSVPSWNSQVLMGSLRDRKWFI